MKSCVGPRSRAIRQRKTRLILLSSQRLKLVAAWPICPIGSSSFHSIPRGVILSGDTKAPWERFALSKERPAPWPRSREAVPTLQSWRNGWLPTVIAFLPSLPAATGTLYVLPDCWAMEDPPRPDSASLVKGLKELGVRVIMVTGDNLATARAVAQQVGIGSRTAGPNDLDRLDGNQVLDKDIYARAFPRHKIELVRRLQDAGHIIAMTGDGVNDAPALKQADIGVAVAGATDVARAAAGVVLTAPGLADVLSAVKISRRIYQRMLTYAINKIMKTLEIAVFLSVGVMLTHTFVITPLLIILLLFTNDFVTMSTATDNVSCSRTPDRWNIKRMMLTGGILAALVVLLSFMVFFVGRDLLGLPLPQLQTLVFVMLVATGQGNVYLVRERAHFWRSRPSTWLVTSSIADLAVVVVMASTGLLMAPINLSLIGGLLLVVVLYLILLDQVKVLIFRRFQIR